MALWGWRMGANAVGEDEDNVNKGKTGFDVRDSCPHCGHHADSAAVVDEHGSQRSH